MASPIDLDSLDSMSRDELVARARSLGAKKAEVMTRVELRDEIIRLSEPDAAVQRKTRGWLGIARDMVASVVESGLNMRDTAALIRGEQRAEQDWIGPPPVATVTLAEIYIAQGHPERALGILDEVLAREPEHPAALALRERLASERRPERRKPRVEAEPETERPAQQREPTADPRESTVDGRQSTAGEATIAAPLAEVAPVEVAPAPVREEAQVRVSEEAPVSEPEPMSAPPISEPPFSTLNPERIILDQPSESVRHRRECVLFRSGSSIRVHWDIAPAQGPLELRVVGFVPKAPLPEQVVQEIPLQESEGDCRVEGMPPQAVVRAAVGRVTADGFVPLAVAVVVEGLENGTKRTVYRPPGQAVTPLEQAFAAPSI